jgi:heat-inducible transcriptional repressor
MSPDNDRRGAPERRNLSPREREVLQAVVSHYIQTGAPVSSRAVSRVNSEHLSPASLRAIMADLEEAGYITHPHTSAGRIPTDLGYRVYVDGIDAGQPLAASERRALLDGLYATGDIESLVARCCKLLSVASNQVGIGTEPARAVTTYRHVELVRLSPHRVLVLFIASSGLVRQHVVATTDDTPPQELERLANFLNEELQGRSLEEVRGRLVELMRNERSQYDVLVRRALEIGSRFFVSDDLGPSDVHVDGTENLLDRPDHRDFARRKSLGTALEDKHRLVRLLDACMANEGILTAIGSENSDPELHGLSVVATSYAIDSTKVGMLGIVGPTRMDYDRAMSLVGYVAELLGTALRGSRS